jgi:hypothetical protein
MILFFRYPPKLYMHLAITCVQHAARTCFFLVLSNGVDNILLGVQTMRPLIQSCPVPCYVIPLTPDSFLNTHEKQQAKL